MRVRNYKAILYRFLHPQRRKPNKRQRKAKTKRKYTQEDTS